MLGWNEYCEIHHISTDKIEIEELIQYRKDYLNYLEKEKKKKGLTNSYLY